MNGEPAMIFERVSPSQIGDMIYRFEWGVWAQSRIAALEAEVEKFTSTNSQSDAIISDIKEVVQSWFKCNDNLTHRECDILNSVVKCYRQK
jgi:hypothetical protein